MLSIKLKMLSCVAIGLVLTMTSVFMVINHFYYKNIRLMATEHLNESQALFNEHIHFDTEKMTAILEMFFREERFKKIFAARDRERLYQEGLPLYKMLFDTYGITHFYFHLPDGTVFLRLHRKELYGDRVTRETYKTAVLTGRLSSGIELGKTAFALRVVAPYRYNSRLIGYVELGEEIDHFTELLNKTKNVHFLTFADKDRLDKDEWIAANSRRGTPANWDRLKNFAWVAHPDETLAKSRHINDANLTKFAYDPAIATDLPTRPDELIMGGFPLKDVQGKHAGVVVTFMDISKQIDLLSKFKIASSVALLAAFVIIFIMIGTISGRWIIKPLRTLSRAARIFAGGDLKSHRISYQSSDEVGQLATAINEMAVKLDSMYTSSNDRTAELETLNTKLESLATTDGLTGLFNHRYFYTKLEEEISRAIRYSNPLSIVMIDIDHFKQYNDTWGHISGDIILKMFSETLRMHSRDTDVVARYGGEEFAIILPESDLVTALAVAERIRSTIQSTRYPKAESQPGGRLSASFGVAVHDGMGSCKEFVELADKALYLAKQNGRDRIMTCR